MISEHRSHLTSFIDGCASRAFPFFFKCSADHRDLHSFPTRRSSDLFPALIVQREFEPASFGMLTALVSSVWQIGASTGPLLLGAIHDLAKSYTAPIFVCAALDVGAAVVILLRPQRRTIT